MKRRLTLLWLWSVGVTVLAKEARGDDDVANHKFLPPHHLPYYQSGSSRCWGHEKDCPFERSFSRNVTSCDEDVSDADKRAFFDEADFGYVGTKLATLEHLCRPQRPGDSEMLCTR